ncbi:selenide, water dikinase SelD, partial [Chloroflexus sp.]|uniref:selenide, water dikinase SelD n=1 Tax=Chloroflexus sp. TaxID=1904827 RepID=UPI0039A6F726
MPSHPQVLVGLADSDDAAVYQLNSEMALVQTVDFFPPIVDDPYTYGAIAAANALSDVYAMGGQPVIALAIAAFPADLDQAVTAAILQGGIDKAAEAGAVVVGGHTVTDHEPKYGLCVTGLVNPRRIITKAGAQPGDRLLLSKPLGTGLITTAAKRNAVAEEDLAVATVSMLTLNRQIAELMLRVEVHAATDVTGYGLLGHAAELARQSKVGLRINAAAVPALPGALRYAAAGMVPGGLRRNLDFAAAFTTFDPSVSAAQQLLLADPQTS